MNHRELVWLMSIGSLGLLLWAAMLSVAHAFGVATQRQRWAMGFAALACAFTMMPVGEFPLARIVAGLGLVPSIPFLALLADTVLRLAFGRSWLRPADRTMGWLWGVLAGAALYPSALGLGRFDAYGLGWGYTGLAAVVAVLAILLLWRGSRFGIVLVLATTAWAGSLLESSNYWDYLVDPVYVVTGLGALLIDRRPPRRATSKVPAKL